MLIENQVVQCGKKMPCLLRALLLSDAQLMPTPAKNYALLKCEH